MKNLSLLSSILLSLGVSQGSWLCIALAPEEKQILEHECADMKKAETLAWLLAERADPRAKSSSYSWIQPFISN